MRSAAGPSARRLGVAALAAALGLWAWVGAARAEDDRAAARYFEKECGRIGAASADRAFELVMKAREQRLNGFAVEEAYRLLLVFDPDHKGAREYLGFAKKAGGWALDPAKADLLDRQNRRSVDETAAAFEQRVSAWIEERGSANRVVAEQLVELGRACADKGYELQARRAYERALAADADCAEAHVGLGDVRDGDLWLSPDEKTAYDKVAAAMPVKDQTPLEAELGASLQKSQSRHFRFQTDTEGVDLAPALRIAEAMYTCFLADFAIDPKSDPFGGKPARLSVVSTPKAWEAWIGLCAPEAEREAAKGAVSYCNPDALAAGTLRDDPDAIPDPLDPLLGGAARLLARRVWRLERSPWLETGLRAYYTVKIRGRMRTFDAAPDPEMPAACSSENWRIYLRDLVRRHEDADLTKIADADWPLDVPSTVKSWAVVSWLMETDRARFVEFLRALGADRSKSDAVAVRVFGKNLFGLDRAWRGYASANY